MHARPLPLFTLAGKNPKRLNHKPQMRGLHRLGNLKRKSEKSEESVVKKNTKTLIINSKPRIGFVEPRGPRGNLFYLLYF